MPWLEIDHLDCSEATRAKLLHKHGIDPERFVRFLLDVRRHPFRWSFDRHPPRAIVRVRFDDLWVTAALVPPPGAPATYWTLATAFRR